MGNALFYHLTRSTAEALVPSLAAKSRQAGWRVELRGTESARMARLDELLWQGDGFLPHGLAGGPHDALQPVLLTVAGQDEPPGADCLIAIDGAAIDPAECIRAQRVCVVFDGNDPAAVERARDQWRNLTGARVAAEYWSEAAGRWEKKR
ncbi:MULTISPECIES: DNA polymerase III subunit chi [unclassified Paracoccus (in: a-proteobacteria)]|uniref:DNA polymerase III subunit chi n=1 Tax=unclassified Paracoccus (in: a-proteobacteria) TaxID=2688777 RepID=UPI0015FEE2BD|nr:MULTISPECIES: DNA polymerase III subunit chi [unclassified Paracoccus (in: a-proteobacteria)]MBB1490435.1 DNA polymerase III subunit chi [Paracoccus sp. MC1854]MBB1497278.1 DNA polymerase III subunit chi [Paracoccus sp. MC1862]QQO44755.1 DNA polymerase III subunit chi [Paracoccus sp. MC1862]